MKLIIGAGDRRKEGWKHHDVRPLDGLDYVCDLRDIRKHIPDESCDNIEITHVLEHFPVKELNSIMEILRSLLKPAGELYIEVPNFRWHAELVMEGREKDAVYYAFGGQLDEFDFHYNGFTPTILKELLEDFNFKNIRVEPNSTITAICQKSAF